MSDWKQVMDSSPVEPSKWDTTSSPTTVYERRDIQQTTTHDDMSDTDSTYWTYEQRTYTRAEYNEMMSPAIQGVQQAISALELAIAGLEV